MWAPYLAFIFDFWFWARIALGACYRDTLDILVFIVPFVFSLCSGRMMNILYRMDGWDLTKKN
jgi:hypothetical protein